MALEHSVLNEQKIVELIKEYWNISVVQVEKMPLGSANCYRVTGESDCYFLKEFQSDFQSEDLIREAELTTFLVRHGIPTAQFIPTTDGKMHIVYQGHCICIEEYMEGTQFGYNDFPKAFLTKEAAMLGKIHKSLSEYDLPMGMDKEWVDLFSVDVAKEKYDGLLCELEKHKEDVLYDRIKEDLLYKKELAEYCEEIKKHYDGITYVSTHGDYQGCQLIFEGEDIKAVIDFSTARKIPAVWEVMRSYVQSSEYSRSEAKIDVEEFCEYVAEYMRYFPLTDIDLKAMPYVYLFQLARSRFGYIQYLTSDSEDREGLIKFALWRTAICREVKEKATDMVTALFARMSKEM